MTPFIYNGLPTRVVFGRGTLARLPEEIARLGLTRVLVLATPQQEDAAREVAETIGVKAVGVFAGAVMHTPVEVTEKALAVVKYTGADGVISLGGGSTIGLGKALAVRTGIDQIAIPTTYAGSEMTPILGETEHGVKTTRRSIDILPETVIYDVDLTLTLPPALSATSGINAIAHAVEGLYAQDANPIVSLMAEESIGALGRSLPRIVADPADHEARADALYGAFLAGATLGSVGMALHHKLCHVLGGAFDLPHAETHTVVLPYVVAFNEAVVGAVLKRVGHALGDGAAGPAMGLYGLSGAVQAPRALKDIGMPEEGLARAADLAVANPYFNPRPVTREDVLRLLTLAFHGEPPVRGVI